jgi:hypothetical protein
MPPPPNQRPAPLPRSPSPEPSRKTIIVSSEFGITRDTASRKLRHAKPGSLRIATIGDNSVARQAGKNDATIAIAETIAVDDAKGNQSIW